jgi:hypothetical protein
MNYENYFDFFCSLLIKVMRANASIIRLIRIWGNIRRKFFLKLKIQ